MKNADKFKAVFGLYATEVWSMPEGKFLRWLNSESTETEQGWIPVNERLPEEMTRVLTTIKVPSREPKVRSGIYSNGLFMNDNGDVWRSTDKEIKAWMPLPEGYQEGEQDGQ